MTRRTLVHTAFHKEILRSITRSLSRFVAIFAIVALGAGFYAGLRMCAPDMRATFDRYFDDTAFMDVRLVSTMGFSDADLAAVRQVGGVAGVMPAHQADATATIGGRRATVRVHSLDLEAAAASDISSGRSALSDDEDYLNRPLLVAGRWPVTSGECILDSSKVFAHTAQLGDSVVLTAGVTDLADTFTRMEFTVVGVFDSSAYVSFARGTTPLNDGNIDRVMYISAQDFAQPHVYTDLYLTVRGSDALSTFTPEYDEAVEPVRAALEALAPEREAARLAEIKGEAQAELDEKRVDLDEAQAEADHTLAKGRAELDDAQATLATSQAQLAKAQQAYDAGVAELAERRAAFAAQVAEGQAQIDAGWVELETQKGQLEQLATALAGLEQQLAGLEAAFWQLHDAYEAAVAAEALGQPVDPSSGALATPLAEAQDRLTLARQAYAAQAAAYDQGLAALQEAETLLGSKQAELEAGKAEARARFAAAGDELQKAKQQLASGYAELADGKQKLAEAEAEYQTQKANAETELAEGRTAIEEAQSDIDAVEAPTWYVLGRDTNTGYSDFRSDADRIEAISLVFPLIFFLVAALVALTTMTRMVDEERTLIGTYKALGYGRGRIAVKYLVYAGIAGVSGSLLGVALGSQVLPLVVWRAYTTMYTAPALLTPLSLPIALGASAAAVGVTLLATVLAVENSLRENPASLMLPRAPKPGRRILLERVRPLWSRLSFSQKVTARNLFRYKKRLLMTVVGIMGCTALLLTGFGLKDSIGDVLGRQYGEVYLYDTTIGLDADALSAGDEAAAAGATPAGDPAGATMTAAVATTTAAADPAASATGRLADNSTLRALLGSRDSFTDYLLVRTEGVTIRNETQHLLSTTQTGGGSANGAGGENAEAFDQQTGRTSLSAYMCCPSAPDRIDEFIRLRTRQGGSPLHLDNTGVILTEKAANKLQVAVGDTVYVERLDSAGESTGETVPLLVTGVTEQYVAHFLYISPERYPQVFREHPRWNGVLAQAAVSEEAAQEALSERLLEEEAVTTVMFADDIVSSFDQMLNSLNSVVLVLILSAGLLAFIVLYNLTNLNIMERRREIATIKVLGFYDAEVNAYIYRETAALTGLGCALGLVLGVFLARFVISTVEVDVVMFGRTIHASSYLCSAALTLLFAAVVNMAMRPRLRRIDMVESLKSVE